MVDGFRNRSMSGMKMESKLDKFAVKKASIAPHNRGCMVDYRIALKSMSVE